MVKIVKTWETVFFHAEKKRGKTSIVATIDLSYNHATGQYTLCTPNQEMVKLNSDPIDMLELKLEAVTAAVKYIKNIKRKKS